MSRGRGLQWHAGAQTQFAKRWAGDKGVLPTVGLAPEIASWHEVLGPGTTGLSLEQGKLHFWPSHAVAVSIRSTAPATDGFIFWCQALALLKS